MLNYLKHVFPAIKFFQASEKTNSYWFSMKRGEQKRRTRYTEVPRSCQGAPWRSKPRLRTYRAWFISCCGTSWSRFEVTNPVIHISGTSILLSMCLLHFNFCNCLRYRLADAQKISIEKSKYLGGWYTRDIWLFWSKRVLLVLSVCVCSCSTL